jgi:ATP-binding cassette subfamily C protein
MLTTLRKCLRLLPVSSRRGYLMLLPLSLLTAAAEMGAAAGIFAIITILTDPSRGLAVGWVASITAHLPWRSHNAVILQLTALLALFYIARSVIVLSAQYFRIRIGHAASSRLSGDMLRRYLSAEYPFHLDRNSSDLIRNCTTAVDESLGMLSDVAGLATDVLMALGMIGVLMATSPGLSLGAGILLVAIVMTILRLTRQAASRFGRGRHDLSASRLRSLQQALGGVKELKVLGRERYFSDEYAALQREALLSEYLGATLDNVPSVAVQTALLCGALGLLVALTVAGQTGIQSLPIAAVFGYAGLRILPMANVTIATLNRVRRAGPAVSELYDDFMALAADDDLPDGPHVEFAHSIALEAVSYTYPSATQPALTDVTLAIRCGESIGIVGATGAGKSTLVDVILGLLSPTNGRITVDGADLSNSSKPWKRRIGYVPQNIYLIDETLRRNIALGIRDADIDDERLRDVVSAAQLEQLVASLPDGLDTQVGERGVRLSGGERQRIAIARALYHDPEVLILDEATASLDVETEAQITRTIETLSGAKTIIVIAHRLSSVKSCDRLVWLANGRVVDVGSFEDLRNRRVDFQALVNLAVVYSERHLT